MFEVLGKYSFGKEIFIGDNKADPRGCPPDWVIVLAILSVCIGTLSS